VEPDVVRLVLPGDRPPWTGTGLTVSAGQSVTLLGSGFIRWSARRDVGAGPKYHLWGRVPGGEIFSCTQDTTTITTDHRGELELCVYAGTWADRRGSLATGDGPYRRNDGQLEVTAIAWPPGADPAAALLDLEHPAVDAELAGAESERLRHPVTPPAGWTHLLDFGTTDIFRSTWLQGRPAIEVFCDDDAGILRKPVELLLDPTTTIEWSWRVDRLASTEPEDTTWTHDYVSIATEFDSGRDLTWFWSSSLQPVDATFACPVRSWATRETHMPVRSGPHGLGQVQREQRNVWQDHRRFMGDPPGAVVAVWLIAVSHFSRSLGHATFSDITLRTGDRSLPVL
jgi:hypothetical protein